MASAQKAIQLAPLTLIPQMLFSGLFVASLNSMDGERWRWMGSEMEEMADHFVRWSTRNGSRQVNARFGELEHGSGT